MHANKHKTKQTESQTFQTVNAAVSLYMQCVLQYLSYSLRCLWVNVTNIALNGKFLYDIRKTVESNSCAEYNKHLCARGEETRMKL